MKKRIWILILFFIFSLCLGSTFFVGESTSTLAEEKPFYQQIAEVDWDYGYISIDKSASINEVYRALSFDTKDYANLPLSTKPMEEEAIKSLCAHNGYVLEDDGNEYIVRHLFSLKSLICIGDVPNNYGAINVIDGYLDFSVCFYDSIEQTKFAYEMMLEDGVKVSINDVVKLNSDYENSAPADFATGSYKTWGASYMGMDAYKNYLAANNWGDEVVVAVIDSGINTSHDLTKDRILKDSSGQWVGYSFVGNSTYTYNNCAFEDDFGHGAHVSGTVAELTPNNVKILPVKIFDMDGNSVGGAVVGAMQYVAQQAAKYNIACVNMSLGTSVLEDYYKDTYGANWKTYFDKAVSNTKTQFDTIVDDLKDEYNVLIVASAGNDHVNTSNKFPANCDNAVTVSSVKESAGTCQFDSAYSNYGPMVKISAPGTYINSVAIASTNKANNGYVIRSGTSMAAPHVSAAVALLCADKMYYNGNTPIYDADDIADRLYDSAIDLGNKGKDYYYGYGLVYLGVVPLPIEYTLENTSTIYDGGYHNIAVSVVGIPNYTIAYGLSANVYNITDITTNDIFKNFTNGERTIYFKISAPGWQDTKGFGKLQINKAPITINVQNQGAVYGSFSLDKTKYSVSSGTIFAGDDSEFVLSTNANIASGVGDYDITMICNSTNYKLTSNKGTLTITPKPITIKIQDQKSTYGNKINLKNEYTLTNGSTLVGDDQLNITTSTMASITSGVGDYDITYKSHDNQNYTVSATKGTLKIESRTISIALQSQSFQYSNTYPINNKLYSVLSGSIIEGDDLGLLIAPDKEVDGVGNYTLSMNSYSNMNYKIASVTPATLTITPKDIMVRVPNQTFTYGDSVDFDEMGYVVVSKLVGSDNLGASLSCGITGKVNVGSYPITLNYTNKNYNVAPISASVIIKPRDIIIKLGEYTFTYGNVDMGMISYTIEGQGALAGDTINIEITSLFDNETDAGEYALNAIANNNNYSINAEEGKVTILPREVTITTVQTKVYGERINLDGEKYTKISGDIKTGDSLDIEFDTEATDESVIGEYVISLASSNKNYDVTLQSGMLQITKRPLKIVLKNQHFEYGDNPVLDGEAYIVKNKLPDFATMDDLKITLQSDAVRGSKIGEYEITATCDNDNYIFSYEKADVKIAKRKVVVELKNQTVEFSDSMVLDGNAYKIVKGSVLPGESLAVMIDCVSHHISSFGGRYVLSATCENENYDVQVINATLTVKASTKHIFITAIVPAIAFAVIVGLICLFGAKPKKKKIKF